MLTIKAFTDTARGRAAVTDDEAEVLLATRFAHTPAAQRASDLVGRSAAAQQMMPPKAYEHAVYTYGAYHPDLYAASIMAMPPAPPDPLETAIKDPEVSIYEVIRLAEERA